MKKLSIIAFVTAAFLVGCSNQGGSQDAEVKNSGTEIKQVAGGDEAAEAAKPIYLSGDEFKKLVMDYEKNPKQWIFEGDKPCIVDFYADWCRPCRMIAPIMDELAAEYAGKVNIYKVNTDKEKELAAVFGITSIPYVLFVPAQGAPSAQRGALPKESYKQVIDDFLLKDQQKATTTN